MDRMSVSCRYSLARYYYDADRLHHCDDVNAPFGDSSLRLDFVEYYPASLELARNAWTVFAGERTGTG